MQKEVVIQWKKKNIYSIEPTTKHMTTVCSKESMTNQAVRILVSKKKFIENIDFQICDLILNFGRIINFNSIRKNPIPDPSDYLRF